MKPANIAKYAAKRDELLSIACKLDDLPDDPSTWTPEQRREAASNILMIGSLESWLRRFARADLI